MSQPTNPYQAPHLKTLPTPKSVKPKQLPIPAWAWIFAVLCGAIPLVTLGGAIPAAIGFGGAGGCIGLARNPELNVAARVIGCIAITAVCWLLVVGMFVAAAAAGS